MLIIKEGVSLVGLRPEIMVALMMAVGAYDQIDKDCVLTSALDGRHSLTSLHYTGQAIDLRTRHLSPGEALQIVDMLVEGLTDDYDIILENNHIHIEFQPRMRS